MWWFLDSEQGFEAGQHQGSKLLRRDNGRNGKHVGQDVGQKMRVFHLREGSGEVRFHCNILTRTSSSSEGRIFRTRSPSEKRSRTLVSPFINDIFSSLDFAAKLDRSKKLSVEIGKDEKKG